MKKISIKTTLVLTDEEYKNAINQLEVMGLLVEGEEYTDRQIHKMLQKEFVYGGMSEIFDTTKGQNLIAINNRIPQGLHFASGLGRED